MAPLFIKVPYLPVKAITLVFVVLYTLRVDETGAAEAELSQVVRQHETIHFWQWLETLVVGFAFIYLWDFSRAWYVRSFKPSEFWNSYLCIRFEQEAYDHDKEENYLNGRKRHAWQDYDVYNPKFELVR